VVIVSPGLCYNLKKRKEEMESKKFDPEKLGKLNDPARLNYLAPDVIWETIGSPEPKTAVDIGAGTGFMTFLFARKMKKGKIYACDISDVMIEWLDKHIPDDLTEMVIPVKMEENDVPLPDGIADLVYMINMHHELENPVRLLAEACRLLSIGGKMMIIDWKKEETPDGPPVSIRVAAEDIEHQLRGAGLLEIERFSNLRYHEGTSGWMNGCFRCSGMTVRLYIQDLSSVFCVIGDDEVRTCALDRYQYLHHDSIVVYPVHPGGGMDK
jgi:ubiquinone/menaquinone biosynthesis C-methylase UbiE